MTASTATPTSAAQALRRFVDAGTLQSWDAPLDLSSCPPDYQAILHRARERSGADEAVITGEACVRGLRVAVVASEFAFLGGSIGRHASTRICAAIRRATTERLPLIATTASGGTRMQEGTPAFLYMVDIVEALNQHRSAGLLYVAHLRHPTTGGVLASWGSLGHVTLAEPGALIGFLGPKVYEQLEGQPFPPGVQTAENLQRHGVVDAVVDNHTLPALVATLLGHTVDPAQPATLRRRLETAQPPPLAWLGVQATRSASHLTTRHLLDRCTDVVLLSGTGEGETAPAMILALGRFDGTSAVIVGHDRLQQDHTPLGPAALRVARRGMALASQLRLPLVTLIDTSGAELSPAAENGALSREIALCIAQLLSHPSRTCAVLVGQGCGGAALALFPAKSVVATTSAWLSPLPPEGASVILFGDPDHGPELADRQGIGARALRGAGTLSRIVPDRPDDTPDDLADAVVAEIRHQLAPDPTTTKDNDEQLQPVLA